MSSLQLELTALANGGAALGRGPGGRVIFVPFAIPGETVTVELTRQRERYAEARLVEVLEGSPDRVEPRCPHFTTCGGCQFQHIRYDRQLSLKQKVVADQLARVGRIKDADVLPTIENPQPYGYRHETTLSPAGERTLGYWSPSEKKVVPIDTCPILHPILLDLLEDIDLEMPDLRKLTLRVGTDEEALVAFEVQNVEPPSLEADFAVSATIILPDRTTANLIGDNWNMMQIGERIFRVTAGVPFPVSIAAAEQIVAVTLEYAGLTGTEGLLELHSGVGWLTAFLSPRAGVAVTIEPNPDAVADAAVNLDDTENVMLYQGEPADILPQLDGAPDVAVIHAGDSLPREVVAVLEEMAPARIVYLSDDAALLARDARTLGKAGFALRQVQPVDMYPQNYQVYTVSLLERV